MTNQTIYTVGGTVQAGSGFYIHRKADDELLEYCRTGEFAFILSSRQVGKSSLMVRTAQQLEKENIRSVIIDLSSIGVKISADEWYLGILNDISNTLNLQTDIFSWWSERAGLGPAQRLTNFFRDVLLKEVSDPVVLFFDEIDSTLSIPFADDFFAALRAIYNARSTVADFKRLSFVMIGVATPSDLIADDKRTPFNIGHRVDLTDFTPEEALPLAGELGAKTMGWVFTWTGGHPYLTQRLCAHLAKTKVEHTEETVAAAVRDIFEGEQGKQDNNLQFVRDMLTKRAPDIQRVLKTYKDVRSGKTVPDDERSMPKSHLKISGVVRRSDVNLSTRNRIYERNFDLKWIKENTPSTTARKLVIASSIVAIIALAIAGAFAWQSYTRTPAERALQYASDFQSSQTSVNHLKSLANLFRLQDGEFSDQALELFNNLQQDQKVELFDPVSSKNIKQDQLIVILGIYQSLGFKLETDFQSDEVLENIVNTLNAEKDPTELEINLRNEISFWLKGRALMKVQAYPEAKVNFVNAIRENPKNPALYFDLARVYFELGKADEYNYGLALEQLEAMLQLDSTRIGLARSLIEKDKAFSQYWVKYQDASNYPLLVSLTEPRVIGVDISFYQNDPETPMGIDFIKMSESAEYVIIRAGQNLWVDSDFKVNWREAKLIGLPRGSYWFYDSRADPKLQAELWVEQFEGDFGELPLFVDFEDTYNGNFKGWENWRDFLERLKQLIPPEKEIAIATGYYYWRENTPNATTQTDSLEYFHQFPLWIFSYGTEEPLVPKPWSNGEWLFWAYTDSGDGKLYGAESVNIDLNYFNGGLETFRTRFDLNN